MTTKVEHGSAPRSISFQQPVARMILWWIERLKGIYLRQHRLSDFTRLNDFLNAFNHWIEMAVVSAAELYLIGATSGDHAIAFAHIHRHRLFAQHMFPCFGGGNGLGHMQIDGCGDVNSIDLLIKQQILPGAVPFRRPKFSGERFNERAALATDGYKIAVRRIAQRRRNSLARYVATTD